MISIEKTEVVGLDHAIRGMRNPKNSWKNSDSGFMIIEEENLFEDVPVYEYKVGDKDLKLADNLASGGPVHATYRRFINVYCDITAPIYWWKEMDRYRCGKEQISTSTMHKVHSKEFTLDDFSVEHLNEQSIDRLKDLLDWLNICRESFNQSNYKDDWWQLIQLLPSSYNQKRTVVMSYEVLANIYTWRKHHKLDEWIDLCKWIETLPYSEIITKYPLYIQQVPVE